MAEFQDDEPAAPAQHAAHLSQPRLAIFKIAKAERDDQPIERAVRKRQAQAVSLNEGKRSAPFLRLRLSAREHGIREINADDARAAPGLGVRFQGDIRRARRQVEEAGLSFEIAQKARHGALAPEAIHAETQDAVQEVVGGRDVREHRLDIFFLDPGRHARAQPAPMSTSATAPDAMTTDTQALRLKKDMSTRLKSSGRTIQCSQKRRHPAAASASQ